MAAEVAHGSCTDVPPAANRYLQAAQTRPERHGSGLGFIAKAIAAEYCAFVQYSCKPLQTPSSTTHATPNARCCTKR